MDSSKIKNVLEVGTNVAVLLAAMTVVAVFGVSLLSGKNAQAKKESTKPTQSQLQTGQILPQLNGIDYTAAPRTLMIMMSTKCKFCLASVPFYRQISEMGETKGGSLHVVAAFPNSSEGVVQFAAENHFPLEAVANLNLDEVGLRYTPTLVLVDKSGTILNTWVGQLTPEGEKNVLERLTGPA